MKQYLLTGLLSAATLGMAAAAPHFMQEVNAADHVKVTNVKNTPAKNTRTLAPGVTETIVNGVKKLNVLDAGKGSINISKRLKTADYAASEGLSLFESFEGWNGSDNEWTPEGWTVDMRGNVQRADSWTPSGAVSGIKAVDGEYMYAINYSMGKQDEWLISPEIEIKENNILSFYVYFSPLYLFKLDNVDWENNVFIGDPVVAATLQIWAQPQGGDWEMLHDFADDYKHMTVSELYDQEMYNGLEKRTVNLNEFAGKKAKIAFRLVGSDGNTMFIDAVSVGAPALEASYMNPFETLYWGFDRTWQMGTVYGNLALYPVNADITWMNMSYNDGATYSWEYNYPRKDDFMTSDNQEELVVSYKPTASVGSTPDLFLPPTLGVTAPGALPGSYTAPYDYFQAGGAAENNTTRFGLLPFCPFIHGTTMVTVDDNKIGDLSIPVFGHNANTNEYWLNYSLNGEDKIEGDYARLTGIANLFMPSEAPLVINGVTVNAYGKVAPDAEFTMIIYGLNEFMERDFSTFTTFATAKIKGSDIIAEYSDDKGYLCLPFDFDEPVVIRKTEENPAYFIYLTGFNSDKVEYFVPIQSSRPGDGAWGYMHMSVDMYNHTGRPAYENIKPLVYMEDGEYVDPITAFAFGLNAEYPWLSTEAESIVLPTDGSATTVALGSYYDGSKLTVEVPAGVEASVAGRYDKCVLTVRHKDTTTEAKGNVVVKGPGVELTLPLSSSAGITDIITDTDAEIAGIYDLSGREVKAANAAPGVYIVKYTNGTARKVAVK